MDLTKALVKYRMTIALVVGLLGPTVLSVLMGVAGLTSPAETNTMAKLVVWTVGVWALGAAGYELVSGWQRRRGDGETPNVDAAG